MTGYPCLHPTRPKQVRRPIHVACWEHWIQLPPDVRAAFYAARSRHPARRHELLEIVAVLIELWELDLLAETVGPR